MAYALRRTGRSSVPSAAIDTVTFRKNSTTFWDECIAHRLGQLPLRGQGSVGSLRICVHNTTPRVQLVTAAALEAVEGDFAAMHPETPLVYLSPDAELDVTCHIRTKTGRDHARFCPALPALRVGDGRHTLTLECHTSRSPREVLCAAIGALGDELTHVASRGF